MNPRPPPSPHALDAEERALAKALPRLHGRTAPGPDLDASILAAAQAAVQPATSARVIAKPRVRWIAPAALAASMVLAVGMAWQLRPLPELHVPQPAPAADAASEPAVVMSEPAASDNAPLMVEAPPTVAKPMLPARKQATAPAVIAQEALPARDDQPASASVVLPPPPPPASPAPQFSPPAPPAAAMAAKAAPLADSQAGALQSQASQDAMRARAIPSAAAASATGRVQAPPADKAIVVGSDPAASNTPARAAPVVAQPRNEAEAAADAGFVDAPEEDIPPATAASPAVRDAWLHRITQLLEQGNRQDAKASLMEFKRRYPNAVLPPALKALDIEP